MPTHSSLRQQPASLCSCWRRFQGIVCNILCDRGNSCWQRMGLVGCGALSTGQNSLCSALWKETSELLHSLEGRGGTKPQALFFFFLEKILPCNPCKRQEVRAMLSVFSSLRSSTATLSCPSLEHLLHGMLWSQMMLEDNQ